MLNTGYSLTDVTRALCARWRPGVDVVPVTDDRVETHVVVAGDASVQRDAAQRTIHFQEWWVRHRGGLPARRFVFVGAETATPSDQVLAALADADAILVAPSNPVVSVQPILAVPGLSEAMRAASARVVGVSPIIAGAPVRGMADLCLAAIGVECSAAGVGGWYGARADGGVLDGWLVDDADADCAIAGVAVDAGPLLMTDPAATAAIVRRALAIAGVADG
jgi:LPPG:FO 2-phospho-L-lactate transferase